jgi:topoisomerase-4 subunit B
MKYGSAFRESFVNLVPTRHGGTHESGFSRGVHESIKAFISANNLLPKGVDITRDDITSNMSFLLSAKVLDPSFEGQTKGKLSNKPVLYMAESCVKAKMVNWLHQNHDIATEIAEMVISSAQRRLKANREVKVRKVGSATAPVPDKLSDCTGKNPLENELFIVEGDSAGGSAKLGRERTYQAIFPLKGKPTNAWDIDKSTILSSEEIHDLALAIGVQPHALEDNPEDVLKDLRYHNIFALTDADVDGYHIEVLLTALFIKHFPHLLTHGHYSISVTPLFKIEAKGKISGLGKDPKFYVLDENERDSTVKKLIKHGAKESNINIQRFKGLGEMNPPQLRETALDKDTRKVIQFKLSNDDILLLRENLHFLFNKKLSGARKEWISSEGDIGKVEE